MIISIAAAVVVLIVALIGVKSLLFPSSSGALAGDGGSGETQPIDSSVHNEAVEPSIMPAEPTAVITTEPGDSQVDAPVTAEGKTLYDNGMATFQYDANEVYFAEMPSDKDNGIPMTSFQLIGAEDTLPRVDFMPLTVSASGDGADNFYNITESEWMILAKALVVGYYPTSTQSQVSVSLSNQIVKVEGTSAKLYASFTSRSDNGTDFDGSVRLIANGSNAVASLALIPAGGTLPSALNDVFMSPDVH